MVKELEGYNWEQAFGEGENFAGIKPRSAVPKAEVPLIGVLREEVARIIAFEEGEHDGQNWVGIFQLKDKRFVTVDSGCDYTGWDCRSSGDVTVSVSIEDAVRYGMTEGTRDRLGFKVTPVGIEFTPKVKTP